MATVSKTLFRGAATTTTSTVLYTVPSATTAVVTSVVVTNTTGNVGAFTMGLGGTNLATTINVGAFDSTVIDLKQVLVAAQTITGGASINGINFHISGVEIV
jgi:hypothetical protein